MTPEDIKEMHDLKWYHKIDLGGGVVTPGRDSLEILWERIKAEMRKTDFKGKRVLDIGCWDGMWGFEAEKLGAAEVVATDIRSQRSWGKKQGPDTFEFAKKHLGSKVEFREVSVYDIDAEFGEEFDIVTFFGVLYHLRYPQLGLAKIRNVMKTGGILLLETSALIGTDDTIIQTDYKKVNPDDVSTWNAFSMPALLATLNEGYFHPLIHTSLIEEAKKKDPQPCNCYYRNARVFVQARAFRGKVGHHFFPDLFLEKFFEPLA